jgi:hypothetical protein
LVNNRLITSATNLCVKAIVEHFAVIILIFFILLLITLIHHGVIVVDLISDNIWRFTTDERRIPALEMVILNYGRIIIVVHD